MEREAFSARKTGRPGSYANMSWSAILILVVGLWLAFKAVKLVFKLLAWCLLLGGAYYLLAPVFGWPQLF